MSDNNNAAAAVVKPHGKRLGRELAMSFLFSCEMRSETPRAELFESFMETVAPEYSDVEAKIMRRAEEYASKLYVTVALNREAIDEKLVPLCKNWDWNRVSLVDRSIMRVAVAEMLHFEDVPLVVSIDEAVEIARDFSGSEAGSFINGVLNAVKDNGDFPGRQVR